jgi:hypothetical protein
MKIRFMLLMAAAWLAGTVVTAQAAAPQSQEAGGAQMAEGSMPFAEFISPADSLPRLRYLADGKITLNDRCPVRKVRLNPRMGAAYVNDHPVGFC